MIFFQLVWDCAAAAAVKLHSSFTGNPVVKLDYQVAPAFERKTRKGRLTHSSKGRSSQFMKNPSSKVSRRCENDRFCSNHDATSLPRTKMLRNFVAFPF